MPDRGGCRPPCRTRPRTGAHPGRRALLAGLLGLAVLCLLTGAVASLWGGHLWYRSLGYSSVYSIRLRTQLVLFVVFGLLMALAVGVNAWLAYRLRPPLSAMSEEQQSLERYRTAVGRRRRRTLAAFALLSGLPAGAVAASSWQTWLAAIDSTPFGSKDPQFHRDLSFYVFMLPWYRFLADFGLVALVVALVAAALTHYLYGGVRFQGTGRRISHAAQGHLGVLLGLFVGMKAVAYWLDRYSLTVRSSAFKVADGWSGLRYTDVNAVLPAKTIMCGVAVVCAALFLFTPLRRSWTLPMVGLCLMGFSSVLVGTVYPAVVQQFQVRPNEEAMEAPYLERNIEATRAAYGIAGSGSGGGAWPGPGRWPGP